MPKKKRSKADQEAFDAQIKKDIIHRSTGTESKMSGNKASENQLREIMGQSVKPRNKKRKGY